MSPFVAVIANFGSNSGLTGQLKFGLGLIISVELTAVVEPD